MNTTERATALELRPYAGEADVESIVRLINLENEADGIPERTSVGEQQARYAHPSDQFDPAADVTLAQVDGEPVAYGTVDWIDTNDGTLREYRVHGVVHPAWRRQGIGARVLAHNERRVLDLAAGHSDERPRAFGAFASDRQPARMRLLQDAGYSVVRYFFDMVRPTLDDVPETPMPDGLEVRQIAPDLYRRVWDADVDAFRDHWGGFDSSDAAFQRWIGTPEFDPTLWVVAFDGDEIAGGVTNSIYAEENEALGVQRGWLDTVFTRRAWRRRGLARALIARSLVALRERGMTAAALGVDAENPSGALGLYESVGFEVEERYTVWRKPMDVQVSR